MCGVVSTLKGGLVEVLRPLGGKSKDWEQDQPWDTRGRWRHGWGGCRRFLIKSRGLG